MTETWEVRAAEKRDKLRASIPKEWILPQSLLDSLPTPLETSKCNVMDIPSRSGLLTEKELKITEQYDVQGLLKALASGELTSFEVTVAFSKRAAIAQQVTGCLTEAFFKEAQERAQHLDDLRKEGRLAGPLHGLPVSLKDTFQLVGKPSTLGLVAFLGHVADTNSAMVDILLGLGAVLYVKTNVPQTMMTADSHNNVFGRVLNPWNTRITAGGSSGGEGALIAFRGSPLGVGTDIAGSIRIPALCCGTYGFKPSSNRVPYGRQKACSDPGYKPILASAGPLANDFEALNIFSKAIIDARPYLHDSTVHDIPWRPIEETPSKRLRIGLLPEDPIFPLHPSVKETIKQAVEVLESSGHEVIALSPEECQVAALNELAFGLFTMDGTAGGIVGEAGEPVIPSRKVIMDEAQSIHWPFLESIKGMSEFKRLSAMQARRLEITDDWRKLWVKYSVDAVLAPSAQSTAVEHDMFGWPVYTGFLNVLDYPACVVPFGTAKDTGGDFKKNPGQGAPDYNSQVVEGAPCSVQVFTSRFRDEECLAVTKVIDQCLQGAR